MIDRELDGRLRRRGKEIVRALRDGAGATEELARLRDEVAALKATTAGLRERLDKLDARPVEPPAGPRRPARQRRPARPRARPRRAKTP
jgi:hypothetical protein